MGTLPGIGFLDKVVKGDIPGLSVDLGNLLHAEHYIKIYRQVKSTNVNQDPCEIQGKQNFICNFPTLLLFA